MRRSFTQACGLGILLLLSAGCVSFRNSSSASGPDWIKANDNSPAMIKAEIASEDFIALLARRTGLPEWRVRRGIPHVELSESGTVVCPTGGRSDLVNATMTYVGLRRAGHSRIYAMARLESEPDPRAIPPDGRAILQEDQGAYLPWLWLQAFKVDGGTNYASYVILDGDLAWGYVVTRQNNRSLIGCHGDWFDAKEVLPQYRVAFEDVARQVEREMRISGDWGSFGSCHVYWARKKELLKLRGIEWQCPSDLHPTACYD